MEAKAITITPESIEAFRSNHRTHPVPCEDGTVRCFVDGFRVYRVKSGAWRHDVNKTPGTVAR
jgi:hypothetical protein